MNHPGGNYPDREGQSPLKFPFLRVSFYQRRRSTNWSGGNLRPVSDTKQLKGKKFVYAVR